jgi:dephospho-CoA kinase
MSGKAGSGKDTVADYLVNNYGFIRTAFADPIRDIVQLTFALDHDSVWDRELRELPLRNLPNYIELQKICGSEFISNKTKIESIENIKDNNCWTVRKLLQFVATEMFRNMINRDTWVMNFVQRIEPGINYVITDVRFPNEMDWVKTKFGGKVIFTEVTRPGCDGKGIGIEGHESEKYKLPADVVIENNGTLEELYSKVTKLFVSYF